MAFGDSSYDDGICTRTVRFVVTNKSWILGLLLFIFFICTISLGVQNSNHKCPKSPPPPPPGKLPFLCPKEVDSTNNCHPEGRATRPECDKRDCCFHEKTETCSFATNHVGYTIDTASDSSKGFTAKLKRQVPSGFPGDLIEVDLSVIFLSNEAVRIKITDGGKEKEKKWEPILPVPLEIPDKETTEGSRKYSVNLRPDGILVVTRKSTAKVLLETDLKKLVFSELFNQVSFRVPSNRAFGFSEHKHNDFAKKFTSEPQVFTVWNRGEQPSQTTNNKYGDHPVYLMRDGDEDKHLTAPQTHAVFLHNSNALDIIVQSLSGSEKGEGTSASDKDVRPSITWRSTGGNLDFFILIGDTPLETTRQYVNLVGKPFLPPIWTLGFHICRYGYTMKTLQEVVDRNKGIIPYDVQWVDIDIMASNHNIWTYDKVAFKELPQLVTKLHDSNMKFIPIQDPSVSIDDPAGKVQLDEGNKLDIFLKDSAGKENFKVQVWNTGLSHWVDFTHDKAYEYWHKMATALNAELPFDGIWIDMNEPYSFLDNVQACKNDITPKYIPGSENGHLNNHTACLNARHAKGSHHDLHNLYATWQAKVTFDTLIQMNKRPFVLTRASSFGASRFTSHWNGDIDSSWDHMRWTIVSLLEFNMYGMPMIGGDICGFQKYDVTEHLCARWHQVGAFYPFSRNHNDIRLGKDENDKDIPKRDNDPGSWPANSPVINSAKKSLNLRYRLLPFLYTTMAQASLDGTPAIRSVWFNNPGDKNTFDIKDQFFWGDNIMIVPILEEQDPKEGKVSKTSRDLYLPSGRWIDIFKIPISAGDIWTGGVSRTNQQIALEDIVVLLKDGSIIATQEPKMTTFETRKQPFTIWSFPDSDNKAQGSLFWDTGDSIDTLAKNEYTMLKFSQENNKFVVKKEPGSKFTEKMDMNKLRIFGIEKEIKFLKIGGNDVSAEKIPKFDPATKILDITLEATSGTNQDLNSVNEFVIEWGF